MLPVLLPAACESRWTHVLKSAGAVNAMSEYSNCRMSGRWQVNSCAFPVLQGNEISPQIVLLLLLSHVTETEWSTAATKIRVALSLFCF